LGAIAAPAFAQQQAANLPALLEQTLRVRAEAAAKSTRGERNLKARRTRRKQR